MNVGRRELGFGMSIAGMCLWVAGVIVDAPTVAITLSILIVMGGAVLYTAGERSD